jgi:hypothetical protein
MATEAKSKQRERFIRTAPDLGCDEDHDAFVRAVRQIVKPKEREAADRAAHSERCDD